MEAGLIGQEEGQGSGEPDGGTSLLDHWRIFGSDHVPYRILLTARLIDRITTQHVREVGDVTLAEWRVLAHLAAMGDKSASAISAAAVVDRSEVSRSVAALLARNLIGRRPNPRNRRSHLLFLTDEGREKFRVVQHERMRFFQQLTAGVTPAQRAMLDELLFRIASNADAMAGARPLLPPEH